MAKTGQEQAQRGEFLYNVGVVALFIGAIAVGAEVLHGALVTH